jgi:hypothetical protein
MIAIYPPGTLAFELELLVILLAEQALRVLEVLEDLTRAFRKAIEATS